ncbi:Chimeric ERCC6-PGBD3 protein [Takifugu flavidus]|uniref:Chimeric ERCC6-PGBD3 protein n=2 Tax=Takifugu flavidus TaxID=433684 RepID=A0A5C6NQC9_9TELE|nr:Chimeric ERCC6-PGBD3 protein [Takifugu flavidus]
MQTEHDWNDGLPFTTPPSPFPCSSSTSSCHNNEGQLEDPRASKHQRGQPEDARASKRQRVQPSQPEEPKAKLQVVKNKDRVFKRSKRPSTAVIPEYTVYRPNAAECVKQSCSNPVDVFLLMYPPTLREITVEMSNLYSTQTKGKQLNLSMDELLTFYGILIASGYSSVPRRHMYWSVDNDVHNESISGAMRRNRFDDIMASVHVVDNTKITDDPFFKVRPIFSELNHSYKIMPFHEWLSVDESMIPYYGQHGCKQFIKGKPIRFGYKVWSLASSSGYMYHMEPYCGSHTVLPETGLGQGPSVIIGLAEQAQVPQGCKFVHDNLFTTLSLMDEMTKRGYGSSGTMRQKRLFDVPFTPRNAFMKLPRGTSEVLCQGEKLLVRWKDNNIVTVATNMEEKYTETSVKRWNRHRRAFDNVQQPKCISRYNEHMGGVDLHDLQVSRYHIAIRSKKWWWPIFAWSINSALVNGHLFYRDVIGGTIDLLTFSRIVSQSLLQRFGTKPLSHGRRSLLSATVENQARYDKASHWLNTMHRFQRCRHCEKRTTYACEKCKVPLHLECFKLYHGV